MSAKRVRNRPRPPIALIIASALVVVESLLLFAREPSPIDVVAIAIASTLCVLMLMIASRMAWVLLVLGVVAQMTGPWVFNQPSWAIVSAAGALIGLLMPASRRFVWGMSRDPSESMAGLKDVPDRWRDFSLELPYRFARVLDRVTAKGVLLRIAGGVLVLTLIDGGLYSWQEGADSHLLFVVWKVVFTITGIAQMTLLALIAWAGYRSVKNRWQSTTSAN